MDLSPELLEIVCEDTTGTTEYTKYNHRTWSKVITPQGEILVHGNALHRQCVQGGGILANPIILCSLLQLIPELAWQRATVVTNLTGLPTLKGMELQLTAFGLLELFAWGVDQAILKHLVSAVAGFLPALPPPPSDPLPEPQLVPLDPSSDEYQLEAARFCDCRTSGVEAADGAVFKVVSIKRVDHAFAHLAFSQYRSKLATKMLSERFLDVARSPEDDVPAQENPFNEKVLYHGTRSALTSTELLATSFDGIDPKYAQATGRFGKGAYFAESPLYSDAYTKAQTSTSTRTMLAVRVLCGRSKFYHHAGDSSLRAAPTGYDSVCGSCEGNTRPIKMFVVYDADASMCTHVIEYLPLTNARGRVHASGQPFCSVAVAPDDFAAAAAPPPPPSADVGVSTGLAAAAPRSVQPVPRSQGPAAGAANAGPPIQKTRGVKRAQPPTCAVSSPSRLWRSPAASSSWYCIAPSDNSDDSDDGDD